MRESVKKILVVGLMVVFSYVWLFIVLTQKSRLAPADQDQSRFDSLIYQIQLKDSIINKLTIEQDSLIKLKNKKIVEIRTVYENNIDYINSANGVEQVELFTRNLSKDNFPE